MSASPVGEKQTVAGFEHQPGRHCGSTALTDLARHHGLDLPEGVLFGLGAGACFYYVGLPGASPSRFINGRTAQLEREFIDIVGAPFRLTAFDGPDESWVAARRSVDAGNPCILLTDLYYLDYYGRSAHFPGHAVVLAGYDAQHAHLADTDKPGLCSTTLESLREARHSQAPPFPLHGDMIDIDPAAGLDGVERRLPALARAAAARAAQQMLRPEHEGFQGVSAIRRLADEVGRWPQEVTDWQWCARFAYQVIERRGTGGGNFRGLYADFLEYMADGGGGGAMRSIGADFRRLAEEWTGLAATFQQLSEAEPGSGGWAEARRRASGLADGEQTAWTRLAEAV